MAAGLISMVCNLSIRNPKFATSEDRLRSVLQAAEKARRQSLDLADEDIRAFESVVAVYRLPRSTDDEKRQRIKAIQWASEAAAEPPLRLAGLAADVIGFCDAIIDCSNPNVMSDIAVAVSMARSGLESSIVNVLINLKSLDDQRKERIEGHLDILRPAIDQADLLSVNLSRRLT